MGLAKWVTVDTAYDEFIIVQMKERFNDTFKDEQFKEISPYLQDIADENGLDYYGKESYGQIFNRPKGSWKYPVNESVDDEKAFKKLLRQNGVTKLPSGMQEKYGKLEWHKYGGYAGEKTIRNMCIQLEHAGWKRGGWKSGGKPDGSVVGNSEDYVSPDGKVAMSYYESFGVTSHDNSYYITFKLVEQVNESTEDDLEKFIVRLGMNGIKARMKADGTVVGRLSRTNPDYADNLNWIKRVAQGNNWEFTMDGVGKSVMFKLAGGQVNESRITGTGRIDFDDDIVAVYTPDGKLEYKGILDDCPYKDDDMKYDKSTMTYRVEGPRGDYRIIAKIA